MREHYPTRSAWKFGINPAFCSTAHPATPTHGRRHRTACDITYHMLWNTKEACKWQEVLLSIWNFRVLKMDAEFLYFSETELLPFDSNKVPEIKEIASSLSPDWPSLLLHRFYMHKLIFWCTWTHRDTPVSVCKCKSMFVCRQHAMLIVDILEGCSKIVI